MESRKRKKWGRARPHRLLRDTSLLRDRADRWWFVPPTAVLARPLRRRSCLWAARAGGGGANSAARADDTHLRSQDGGCRVPSRFAGVEELHAVELRATEAGESPEDKRLCVSFTVTHDHPELCILARRRSFPIYSA